MKAWLAHVSLKTALALGLLTASAVAGAHDFGDRVEHRMDRKGDRIEHRLDHKGDRIDARLDRRAGHAASNGHYRKAYRLDRKGDRIDARLDHRGHVADARWDRRGQRFDRRSDRRH